MSEKPNTKDSTVIKALVAHRDRLDVSDTLFARRYLGISPTTWSQLKNGHYPADPEPMLLKCATALAALDEQAERAADASPRARIVELAHVRAALAALNACHGEPQNRLVVALMPSGGGKTTLARRVREKYLHLACAVEATETWRSSYFNACCAVAEALGHTEQFTSPRTVEAAVLDSLSLTPRILVIDEGHYLGPAALNLLKVILNKTSARVLLLAIPELWQRMEAKAFEEVRQLRRRTAAKIVLAEVTRDDARRFLAARLPGWPALAGEDERAATAACCTAANKFGLFDTLDRICVETAAESGESPTLEHIQAAIRRVEALRT